MVASTLTILGLCLFPLQDEGDLAAKQRIKAYQKAMKQAQTESDILLAVDELGAKQHPDRLDARRALFPG